MSLIFNVKFNAVISVKDPLTRFVSTNERFLKVETRITVCLKRSMILIRVLKLNLGIIMENKIKKKTKSYSLGIRKIIL